jgi:enterochelin esterase-like enzyme
MSTTVSRRALLGGAAAAVGLGAGACGADRPGDVVASSGTLTSRHCPGRTVHWQLVRPKGVQRPPLVVVLHGKGGDASHAFRILHLDDHVAATGLALVSVDGGDDYWHARRSGVDPGAMVVEDLLPLARKETGYDGRIAFLGWSMGGYGSLLLASELGPDRVFAVVAESAALWTTPGASAAGAFDDREDFLAHDVFAPRRLAVLRRIPVRLDCGRSDPFVSGNRAFAQALPTARLAVDDGGHTAGYWRDHGRAQLRWVAAQPR